MLTLHHLEHSRSQRVLWLLEELGVPYEIVRYARNPKTLLAPPELEKVHPLGKSPVITDGDATIAESGAILEYLAERHGAGRWIPEPGTPDSLRCRYFLHYAEGSLMTPLLVKLLCSKVRSAPLPFFLKPVAKGIAGKIDGAYTEPNLRRHAAFLETELGRGDWLVGDEPTIADVQMSYPAEALADRGKKFAGPNLLAFVARVRARPAYQRAVEKGGPTFDAL